MWSTSASTSRAVARVEDSVRAAVAARPVAGAEAFQPVGGAARPSASIRAAIAAALALYLEGEGGGSAVANAWGSAARPDDRDAGRPWIMGSDVWRRAERPR